jgi:hypothetical protein
MTYRRLALLMLTSVVAASCGHPSTFVGIVNRDDQDYVVRVLDASGAIATLALPASGSGIAAQASVEMRVRIQILDAASCSLLGEVVNEPPETEVTVSERSLTVSDDITGSAAELRPTVDCELTE